jgi:multisubunit Na+/H+ antiporter MnhB subunit
MNFNKGPIAVTVVLVCLACAQYGRRRRASGRPVTPRDTVLLMGVVWAVAWLTLGLPPLFAWGRLVPLSETLTASFGLVALAVTPLLFLLAASWLPRLNAGAAVTAKKPTRPDPLD